MPLILHIKAGDHLQVGDVVRQFRRRGEIVVITPDAPVERLDANQSPVRKDAS